MQCLMATKLYDLQILVLPTRDLRPCTDFDLREPPECKIIFKKRLLITIDIKEHLTQIERTYNYMW